MGRPASRLPMRNWNWQFSNMLARSKLLASRLPMRNWNLWCRPQDWLPSRLPDYLWGIETLQACSSCLQYWLPDYLWGIETDFSLASIAFQAASRLPMRNWNFWLITERTRMLASRLPMRNWNQPLHGLYVQEFRFQTTYEELKLFFSLLSEPWTCFQTTYEELKHVRLGYSVHL